MLQGNLVAGSVLRLRLAMTKFAPPSVRIAFTVRVEPESAPNA